MKHLILSFLLFVSFQNLLSAQCTLNSQGCAGGGYEWSYTLTAAGTITFGPIQNPAGTWWYVNGVAVPPGTVITGPGTFIIHAVDPQPTVMNITDAFFNNCTGGTCAYTTWTGNGGCGSVSAGHDCGIDGCPSATCGMAPMPVHLIYFRNSVIHNKIVLDWATSMQENTNRFEVEKSFDAVNYSLLTSIKAQNTNNINTYYKITDESPISKLQYYRLKIIDNDNSYTYSNVLKQEMDITEPLQIQSIINTQNEISVSLYSSEKTPITIFLRNLNGQIIYQQKITSDNNIIKFSIPTFYFSSGIYTLQFITSKSNLVKKVELK